jgi:hypothetical protein
MKFSYTRSDYLSAMGTRYGRTTRAKIDLAGSVIALALGLLCLMFIGPVGVGPYLTVLGPYLIGVGMGWLAFTMQHYGFDTRSLLGQDVHLGEELALSFSDEGLALTSAHSSFKADWAYYQDAIETRRVYLLFWAANVHTIIPKRAFATPQAEQAFRHMVKAKVPSAALA